MFFLLSWDYRFWGRKTAEVECLYHPVILSTFLIVLNVDLDHLAEIVFVSYSAVKLLFFSLSIWLYFLEGCHYA